MKWYENTWIIILFLILFWPVGLFFMWKSNWNKIAKITITAFIAMVVFVGCLGGNSDSNSTNTNQTKKEVNNTVDEDKEKKNQEEQEKKTKELEEKYKPILESGKLYANMTNEEGVIVEDLVKNWDTLTDEFKSKYNDSKATIEKSITDYKNQKAAEEVAARAAAEEAAYNSGITYEQLARTPDNYKGQKVTFSGKVVQVIEGDKETDLRIAVDGNYDTVIFVGYDPSIASVRALDDDYVTIKGKSIGLYSYQSTIGGKISIPGIWVDKIEINQ